MRSFGFDSHLFRQSPNSVASGRIPHGFRDGVHFVWDIFDDL
jgi:hypothetical protein